MKKFLLVLAISTISISSFAQGSDPTSDNDKVYTEPVEVMPAFKGGMSRFYARLQNIPYLFLDRLNKREGETIAILIIEKDGNVSNVKVLHGISKKEDDEMIRVIGKLQKWKPGMHDGKPVRVQYAIPINFQIADDL